MRLRHATSWSTWCAKHFIFSVSRYIIEKWHHTVCLTRLCVYGVCTVCVRCVYSRDLSPISSPQTKPAVLQGSKRLPLTSLLVDQVLRFQHAPLPLSVDCTLSLCLCCSINFSPSVLHYRSLFLLLQLCVAKRTISWKRKIMSNKQITFSASGH